MPEFMVVRQRGAQGEGQVPRSIEWLISTRPSPLRWAARAYHRPPRGETMKLTISITVSMDNKKIKELFGREINAKEFASFCKDAIATKMFEQQFVAKQEKP